MKSQLSQKGSALSLSKGFTLVEMLIVIAIIAILASVSLVSVSGVRQSARDTKRVSDINKIQQQLEVYYSRTGKYPTAITDIEDFINTKDPIGELYEYSVYNGDQSYVVGIMLEGGSSATEESNEIDTLPSGAALSSVDCNNTLGFCVGN
ncbi:MAG: hypothetical protein ACD_81C00137G0004 [uncultured bacterium]|uniref:Fimbrial protein pilin n=1 Tax=Candidatus Wolfebacteria bacterium GW2011_GWE2_44_13 TaxID=1619017 RepID=A0A0G1HA77_9BACT|nr:MAG: hypothetical protein ACD_81C00137G0004 [uncultured bacterium]KKT43655.1 MAG: fimbrial protein pilin [Candidatus Wolfebacteria bacterium GW2011_GWE2_44_13]